MHWCKECIIFSNKECDEMCSSNYYAKNIVRLKLLNLVLCKECIIFYNKAWDETHSSDYDAKIIKR